MIAANYHVEIKGRILWHYRIVAQNGQVLSTSQTYYSKSNATRAARKVAGEFGFKVVNA